MVKLEGAARKVGLKINEEKTKTRRKTLIRQNAIPNNNNFEKVDNFLHLAIILTKDNNEKRRNQ